jgi:two-component system, LytTR family, sensor kinase
MNWKQMQIIFSKYRRFLSHLIFWTFYVLFFGSVYGKYGHNFQWYFIESLCMLPFVMAATYTTVYAVLPWYLRTRKLTVTIVLVICILLLATLGERISLRLINGLPVTSGSVLGVTFLYLFLETNFMVAIVFAIKMVKKWFEQQKEKHEIEKQNLKKELNLLKAQLNPHFLFNTLNNLYSISMKEASKTSEGIAQMAGLLQAVLYECNEAEVALEKEVKLIENYMELERLRYGEQLRVKFEIIGMYENRKIAPMLLFTFVENCFKHGGANSDGLIFIHIMLENTDNGLRFSAKNTISCRKEGIRPKAGGIGIQNAQKRLDILYDGRYRLQTDESINCYNLLLEIEN